MFTVYNKTHKIRLININKDIDMETTNKRTDAIDAILAQWHRERPDLDVSPMAVIGRIRRCATLLQRKLDETFAKFGMSSWEFDVLATLCRSGAPYCLTPTALFSSMMITSGTMTHRLQRLEAENLIQRLENQQDKRSLLVQLTDKGFTLINRAVEAHIMNERKILSSMSEQELAILNQSLTTFLGTLDSN